MESLTTGRQRRLDEEVKQLMSRNSGYGFGVGYGYSCAGDFGFGGGDQSTDSDIHGTGHGAGAGAGRGFIYATGQSHKNSESLAGGRGDEHGNGLGIGYGGGIGSICGRKVVRIAGIETIMLAGCHTSGYGLSVESDLTLKATFIAKHDGKLAHGSTAVRAAEAARSPKHI